MEFQEMDPEIAWKLIEGYEDELSPAHKVQEAFYRQFTCPRCGRDGLARETISARHAFSDPDSPVPRAGLRCNSCSCLFDPHTGMLVEMGNPAKIPPDIPIIDPTAD
jgi:hypothetical protein